MQLQSLGQEDALKKGNGNPSQYSCLRNPVGRGAWWATVYVVAKSQTQLKSYAHHIYMGAGEIERERERDRERERLAYSLPLQRSFLIAEWLPNGYSPQ